ncbi:hypothetical protein [Ulvibacterium sp.]|uniref:hypothetical protein n=1 Tax=Ulvibacterium sp. TaxID=2665914 RepID=UPI003CC6983D
MKKSNSVWVPMYLMIKNLCFIVLIGAVLLSCNKDDGNPILQGKNKINYITNAKVFKDMNNKRLSGVGVQGIADFVIDSVARVGTLLKLSVSYGGGCQNHYFDVAWDGIVKEISPCKTTLLVSHRADNDDFGCNRVINETLEIDLEELFGKDNAEALPCSIDVYSIINGTIDPDISCCFR